MRSNADRPLDILIAEPGNENIILANPSLSLTIVQGKHLEVVRTLLKDPLVEGLLQAIQLVFYMYKHIDES